MISIDDEKFSYLLNLLSSVYEPNGFMHPLDADKSYKDLNERPNEDTNKTSNGELNDGSNDGGHFLKKINLRSQIEEHLKD